MAVKLNGVTAYTKPSSAAVVGLVPGAVRADRLLVIQLLGEGDVEAPEVDELGGRIDLRLKHRLRLAEHRRRIQRLAPGRREQLRRAQKHGGAILPGPVRPLAPRLGRGVDRLLHFLRAGLVPVRQHVGVLVRHHRLRGPAGADFASRR